MAFAYSQYLGILDIAAGTVDSAPNALASPSIDHLAVDYEGDIVAASRRGELQIASFDNGQVTIATMEPFGNTHLGISGLFIAPPGSTFAHPGASAGSIVMLSRGHSNVHFLRKLKPSADFQMTPAVRGNNLLAAATIGKHERVFMFGDSIIVNRDGHGQSYALPFKYVDAAMDLDGKTAVFVSRDGFSQPTQISVLHNQTGVQSAPVAAAPQEPAPGAPQALDPQQQLFAMRRQVAQKHGLNIAPTTLVPQMKHWLKEELYKYKAVKVLADLAKENDPEVIASPGEAGAKQSHKDRRGQRGAVRFSTLVSLALAGIGLPGSYLLINIAAGQTDADMVTLFNGLAVFALIAGYLPIVHLINRAIDHIVWRRLPPESRRKSFKVIEGGKGSKHDQRGFALVGAMAVIGGVVVAAAMGASEVTFALGFGYLSALGVYFWWKKFLHKVGLDDKALATATNLFELMNWITTAGVMFQAGFIIAAFTGGPVFVGAALLPALVASVAVWLRSVHRYKVMVNSPVKAAPVAVTGTAPEARYADSARGALRAVLTKSEAFSLLGQMTQGLASAGWNYNNQLDRVVSVFSRIDLSAKETERFLEFLRSPPWLAYLREPHLR
ncbi:MAG: hypothetical protein AABZ44_01170, partial [Elusimicrobiota bacterium]